MPDNIRSSLERNLNTALASDISPPAVLQHVYEGADVTNFCSFYFSWYSRCTTKVCRKHDLYLVLSEQSIQGTGAPPNEHPFTLYRDGKSVTHHWQMLPYISKDLKTHQDVYHNLCVAFEELFSWIENKV